MNDNDAGSGGLLILDDDGHAASAPITPDRPDRHGAAG